MFKRILKRMMAMGLFMAIIMGLGAVYSPTREYAIDTFFWLTMSPTEWKLYFCEAQARRQLVIAEKNLDRLGRECFIFSENMGVARDQREFTEVKAIQYRDAYNLAVANSQENVSVDGRHFTVGGLYEYIQYLFDSVLEQEASLVLHQQRLAVAQAERLEIALAIGRAEHVIERIKLEKVIAATSDSTNRIDGLIADVNSITETNKRINVNQFVTSKQLYADSQKTTKPTASSAEFDAFMNSKGGVSVALAK